MNRHAEKELKPLDGQDSSHADPDLDGVVCSIHYCPGCGKVEAVVEPASQN
jgi:hypothetical protein